MNNKNFKTIIIVALLALVTTVGIGYATITTTLTINGSGTVKGASWEIKFANLSDATLVGTATEDTKPSITNEDTSIGDFAITLSKPGDSVEYTFDVVNSGMLDAKISTITINVPSCTEITVSRAIPGKIPTVAQQVCSNLKVALTYTDGTAVAQNDTLAVGETKHMKMTITYSDTITTSQLPENDIAVTNLGATIVYVQNS